LLAQETSASITGTVTDATGAAVPGADIVLTNPATGQTYKGVTSANGTYTVTNVTPGPGYTEAVTHAGFQKQVLNGLYLSVATTRTQNVTLSAGGVNETVEVSASNQDVTLDTTDATIGNVVQVQYLNDLPVQVRDSPVALFYQQPGFTEDGSSTGARPDQNRLTLDGLDVTDQASGSISTGSQTHGLVAGAPVDSVEEFRGTTAGMTAADGVGGGAQFSLVTKGGTNRFHGNINEYHRDTDLEANDWFSNFEGVPRSPLIRNQFGGNFGGPVRIPKLFDGRDKLFFFFDYDGRRDTLSGSTERTVPTTTFLNRTSAANPSNPTQGDTITYYTNIAAGTTNSINTSQIAGFDPKGTGLDPALAQVTGTRFPAPNDFSGDQGDLLNTAGYRFNTPTPYKQNTYVGRLDYSLTQTQRFFGRVTYNKISQSNIAQFLGDPAITQTNDSHAWVVGWDSTWGSNKTNSLIWGETVANLGYNVPASPQGTNGYGLDGSPTGGFFLSGLYAGPGGSSKTLFPIPVVRDDFTWQKGSHSLAIGGDFKYPTPHYASYNDYNGPNLGLGGGVTGLTDTDPSGFKFRPDDLDRNQTSLTIYDSAFVYGLGRFASDGTQWNYNAQSQVVPNGTGLQTQYKYYETELYFSDTWKVTPKLTLTYGVRYQDFTVPYEIHGIESVQNESFWDFMDARISQSAAGVSGNASLPGGTNPVPYISYDLGGKANKGPSFYAPDKKDFAPRFAFAWTPFKDKKFVVNGGAGLIYDETIINALLQEQSSYSYLFDSSGTKNFGLSGNSTNSAAYLSLLNNPRFSSLANAPQGPTAPTITKPDTPFVGPTDPNCGGGTGPCGLANGGAFNITVDRKLPTPYNLMFNLGVQQELGKGFLLKLSWVNRLGRRLLGQADAEQLIDFPDKVSGQTLSQAMAALTTYIRQNPNSLTPPPQPWFENVLNPNGAGVSNTAFIAQNLAPYPARGDVADSVELMSYFGLLPNNVGMAAQYSENTFFTDGGFSDYNGLLTTIHKNASHGLQFDFNYTWSHSIDNVSQIANSYAYTGYGFLCDILRPRLCRANSDFDHRNYFNGNLLYQLPFGKGRDFAANVPWYVDEAIGGWEVSALPVWHDGSVYMANSVAFLMSYSNEDPALLTGPIGDMKAHVNKQNGELVAFKNQAKAFSDYTAPVGFQFGPRNNLRGPGFFLLDMGLGKTFTVWPERVNLKFRADAFNVLNHPNFQNPNFEGNMLLIQAPQQFGVIPGTQGASSSDSNARVLQGSLRLEF
jgi:hypothetical protein